VVARGAIRRRALDDLAMPDVLGELAGPGGTEGRPGPAGDAAGGPLCPGRACANAVPKPRDATAAPLVIPYSTGPCGRGIPDSSYPPKPLPAWPGRASRGAARPLVSLPAAVTSVAGVKAVRELRIRWIGHTLRAEVDATVDPDLTVTPAHAIAHHAEIACSTRCAA
jgi:hypothetical protein